jgi:hypothetical protein
MEKYFEIPDVNLPLTKLYFAMYEIAMLYDQNRWNGDIQHQLYGWMYFVKNKLMKPEYKPVLKSFLQQIQVNPNQQAKGTLWDYQLMGWV